MDVLAYLFRLLVDIMKIPFTIWGFTLSFWEILIYTLVVPIVLYLIVGFFDDD